MDDDVLREVKAYATNRNITIGKAVSELVREGLRATLRTRVVNGFQVVELPSDSPQITTADVKRLEEECLMQVCREQIRQMKSPHRRR
jgi:hypothetical protein